MTLKFFSSWFASILPARKDNDSMRKEHGFADFDTHKEQLRNYNPAAELESGQYRQQETTSARTDKADKRGGRR